MVTRMADGAGRSPSATIIWRGDVLVVGPLDTNGDTTSAPDAYVEFCSALRAPRSETLSLRQSARPRLSPSRTEQLGRVLYAVIRSSGRGGRMGLSRLERVGIGAGIVGVFIATLSL